MSLLHGLYVDLGTNQNEESAFTKVDRPSGNEHKVIGKAPDGAKGQTGLQNYSDQLNTESEFNYYGKRYESYKEIITPKLYLSKPLTLWLYCNNKDREKFFSEMRLLVENFDNYFFTDMDTVKLQCWQIGFTNREIYFLVLKRFPKLIHKTNPEYPFLGCELLRTKTTINDVKDDDGKRILTTTYCQNLCMSGFFEYMSEFSQLWNKQAAMNWVNANKNRKNKLKPLPTVNLSDSRLCYATNFKPDDSSILTDTEKNKYLTFWKQNDTSFTDTYDSVKRGFDSKDINIGIRNYVDLAVSKVIKNPDKSTKFYDKHGHGLRPGVNTKTIMVEGENGKLERRTELLQVDEPKGPRLSEKVKSADIKIKNNTNKKLGPKFDNIEMDTEINSHAFVVGNNDIEPMSESTIPLSPCLNADKKNDVLKLWTDLIQMVGLSDVQKKNELVIQREIIIGKISKCSPGKTCSYLDELKGIVSNNIENWRTNGELVTVPDKSNDPVPIIIEDEVAGNLQRELEEAGIEEQIEQQIEQVKNPPNILPQVQHLPTDLSAPSNQTNLPVTTPPEIDPTIEHSNSLPKPVIAATDSEEKSEINRGCESPILPRIRTRSSRSMSASSPHGMTPHLRSRKNSKRLLDDDSSEFQSKKSKTDSGTDI